MAVKTDILNNLGNALAGLGIFKKVSRGLEALENYKKTDFPICVFNSFKTEKEEVKSTYNRQVRRMYVEIVILDKKRKDYFDNLDDYEDKLIKYIEDLMPYDLHQNCLTVFYIQSEELINDEQLDGLFLLKITIAIDYID
jgi:hypothetical protein